MTAPQKSPQLLLINAWPSTNKGSAAMAVSAVQALATALPGAVMKLLIPWCDPATSSYSTRFTLLRSAWDKRLGVLGVALAKAQGAGILWGRIGSPPWFARNDEIQQAFAEADAVINLGGDTIDELYGYRGIGGHTFSMAIGLLLRKPVVIYAQSVGCLEDVLFARPMLERCSLVIARERISYQRLQALGLPAEKLFLTADTAFLLGAAPAWQARALVEQEAPELAVQRNPYVGFSPAESILKAARLIGREIDAVSVWRDLIEHSVTKLGMNALLVPHNATQATHEFTASICQALQPAIRHHVGVIRGDHEPEELKGIIGQAEVFVGGRMHANIAALSMGVPTLAIAYSDKFHGIMGSAGQERWVLPLERFGFDEARVMLDQLWAERQQVRAQLTARIPDVKKQAFRSAEIVRDWLLAQESK